MSAVARVATLAILVKIALLFSSAALLVSSAALAQSSSSPSSSSASASSSASSTKKVEDPEVRRKRAAAAFAPFDAGDKRAVTRGGVKGKARPAHPHVGDGDKVPGEGPPPPPLRLDPDIPELAIEKPNAVTGLSANPLFLASLVYANLLTKLDGPRCGHLPTCSRFASQAVGRHGALGVLMGLDRLQQPNDSSAIRKLPEIEGFGAVRGFDPVENYEFWISERFTGFPLKTPEQPLDLSPAPPKKKKKTAQR